MMPDMDLGQAYRETVEVLQVDLQTAYTQIGDLVNMIHKQDAIIAKLRQRMQDHGLYVLEKSIVETTREELELINKSIPSIYTTRVDNPEKMKRKKPTEEDLKVAAENADEQWNNSLQNLIDSVTKPVDLEKYGIDPQTLLFKPGWGPQGKLPELTRWQKIKRVMKRSK